MDGITLPYVAVLGGLAIIGALLVALLVAVRTILSQARWALQLAENATARLFIKDAPDAAKVAAQRHFPPIGEPLRQEIRGVPTPTQAPPKPEYTQTRAM